MERCRQAAHRAEAEAAGACFSHMAHRNEVSRGLLWNWRAQVRRGKLRPEALSVFVPVQVVEAPPVLAPVASPLPASTLPASQPPPRVPERRNADDQIEVEFPDGSKLRVGGQVSLVALRRVVVALRG